MAAVRPLCFERLHLFRLAAFLATSCVRPAACHPLQHSTRPQVNLKAALLATAGSLLLMAGAAGAKPIRLVDVNAERAEQLAQQTSVLEYALRQQETARQAQLAAQ
jgi:hypothetical protein